MRRRIRRNRSKTSGKKIVAKDRKVLGIEKVWRYFTIFRLYFTNSMNEVGKL